MKYIVTIFVCLGLLCCNSNQKTSKPIPAKLGSEITLKSKYPDLCNKYLVYKDIDSLITAYCNGTFQPSDNDLTVEFLNIISQKNDSLFPFYYRIYNHVLDNSDGALSELLPGYCLQFIQNYPVEVIKDFNKNPNDLENYAQLLGFEFYLYNDGTSSFSMSYDQFKGFLSDRIDLSDKQTNNTYNQFVGKIDASIRNME